MTYHLTLAVRDDLTTEDEVREFRNYSLLDTDIWAISDHPDFVAMSDEKTLYRQKLRDIPEQSGFPANVVWPTKPE